MSNPLDAFANHGANVERSFPRRQARERPTDHQREAIVRVQKEKDALSQLYGIARQRVEDAAFDCPEGPRARRLLEWVATLGIDDAGDLVGQLAAEDWLLNGPVALRWECVHLLGLAIERIRKKAGHGEFNDPVHIAGVDPPEEAPAFDRVKNLLGVR